RPRQRGRKARAWERPDHRQIRELHTTYNDNCQCKVIPRCTFNGAEMPLQPLLQYMQDKYQAEYYAARRTLTDPKVMKHRRKIKFEDIPTSWGDLDKIRDARFEKFIREMDQYAWGVGRKPHV